MAEGPTNTDLRVPSIDDGMPGLAGGGRASLTATGFMTLLNLRGSPGDEEYLSGVHRALGVSLPLTPNRWHENDGRIVMWLGPDEWLVVAADGEAPSIETALRETVGDDSWLSVVDVSNSFTGFALAGSAARDVLAKGCTLDLHPSVVPDNHCAQTLLAGTRVLLRVTRDPGAIEIRVRNSFARYTARWLADAMAEYRE